jgi:hypothetical protein
MGLDFRAAAGPSVTLRSTLGFMLAACFAGSVRTSFIVRTFESSTVYQGALQINESGLHIYESRFCLR